MLGELVNDKYGIGWSGIPHAKRFPELKAIALAQDERSPYVPPSRETVQNRTYPLARSVFMYIKRPPGQGVDPKVREFLRYVLSQEGQAEVARKRIYLPLTPNYLHEQLKKLD